MKFPWKRNWKCFNKLCSDEQFTSLTNKQFPKTQSILIPERNSSFT